MRPVLKDPVARKEFLSQGGNVEFALRKVNPTATKRSHGLLGDIEQLSEALRRYPWTTLTEMKNDGQVIRSLEEAEKLLSDLKKALSK